MELQFWQEVDVWRGLRCSVGVRVFLLAALIARHGVMCCDEAS